MPLLTALPLFVMVTSEAAFIGTTVILFDAFGVVTVYSNTPLSNDGSSDNAPIVIEPSPLAALLPKL